MTALVWQRASAADAAESLRLNGFALPSDAAESAMASAIVTTATRAPRDNTDAAIFNASLPPSASA